MTYYRIAWKSDTEPFWQWKSTKLSSLDALFGFLRAHSALPIEQLYIFSSSSTEGLQELLRRKNSGLTADSICVTEFLTQQAAIPASSSLAEEQALSEEQWRASIAFSTSSLPEPGSQNERPFSDQIFNDLHSRRFACEQGIGGDHDSTYTFTLPASTPLLLKWMKLLGRVQRGELAA